MTSPSNCPTHAAVARPPSRLPRVFRWKTPAKLAVVLAASLFMACGGAGGGGSVGGMFKTTLRYKSKKDPQSQDADGLVLSQSFDRQTKLNLTKDWHVDEVRVKLSSPVATNVTLHVQDGPSTTATSLASEQRSVSSPGGEWFVFHPRDTSGNMVLISASATYYIRVEATAGEECRWAMSIKDEISHSAAYRYDASGALPWNGNVRDFAFSIFSKEKLK